MKKKHRLYSILILLFALSRKAMADQYHYANSIVGTKALGLGGAFTALSDDSSGVYFNPGGTPFASTKDISGSASAFYLRKKEYAEVFGSRSLVENSRGTASSFLGGLVRVGSKKPKEGLTLGLALWMPDNNLAEEDATVQNESSAKLIAYKKQGTQRSGTVNIAGSVGWCWGESLGMGLSLGFFDIDELSQSSERILQGPYTYTQQAESTYSRLTTRQDTTALQLRGVSAGAGLRWNLTSSLYFGLSGRSFFVKKKQMTQESSTTVTNINAAGVVVSQNKATPSGDPKIELNDSILNLSSSKVTLPLHLRLGLAWNPARWFTASADVSHATSTENSSEILPRRAVSNLHFGLQWAPFGSIFSRIGGFTNYDADPSRDVLSSKSRGEYVDAVGLSGSVGMRYSDSEYGFAMTRQWGDGLAQKFPGRVSNVTAVSTIFSATVSQGF